MTLSMRIIKTSMLHEFWRAHPEAEASLRTWVQQTKAAQWRNFADVRRTFPSADQARGASYRPVVIFNIAHNRYRLIAALHYNTQIAYTMMILTHKEYDRNAWKDKI
jgi:mRNA interferase HigB